MKKFAIFSLNHQYDYFIMIPSSVFGMFWQKKVLMVPKKQTVSKRHMNWNFVLQFYEKKRTEKLGCIL